MRFYDRFLVQQGAFAENVYCAHSLLDALEYISEECDFLDIIPLRFQIHAVNAADKTSETFAPIDVFEMMKLKIAGRFNPREYVLIEERS